VRGAGGYIIVPPSVHTSGTAYEFLDENASIAPALEWLLEMVTQTSAAPDPNRGTAAKPRGDAFPEGQRNPTLMSLAGSMRSRGMTLKAIEAALLTENAERCVPPLDEQEVREIAHSASRHEPAPAKLTTTVS